MIYMLDFVSSDFDNYCKSFEGLKFVLKNLGKPSNNTNYFR